MNKFEEVKEKVLLSSYIQGDIKIFPNRIRVNPCPLCGGHDCFDIIPAGAKGNEYEYFKCFQCGENDTGSIIDFYCLSEGLNPKNKEDVSKAIDDLCSEFRIDNNTNYQAKARKSSKSHTEPQIDKYKKDNEYNFTELAEQLHENAINAELGKSYFIDRGISEELIKKYKLGFAAGGMNEAFKSFPEFQQKYEALAQCYKFFIPIFDKDGKCVYILTRRDDILFESKLRTGELAKTDRQGKENKYFKNMNLKGVPTVTYNLAQAMKHEIVYICEGWCDALSIEEVGGNAAALNSISRVNSFIKEIQIYENYQSKFYVIALDNDEAGRKARKDLESKLSELKCKVKHLYVDVEGCKDVNDLLVNEIGVLSKKLANMEYDVKKEKEKLAIENSNYSCLNSIIEKFRKNKNRIIPSTGYATLDEDLGGGLYNSLYVIGGITGLGKTSLVLNIGDNLAADDHDVLIISLEMSKSELIAKSLARHMREKVDNRYKDKPFTQRQIQNGEFEISDRIFQIGYLSYKEKSKNIFIKEANFNYNTEKIREDIINHKILRGKTPIVIVDYLQVLPCLKDYGDDKKNIDFNITELKRISREYETPVIVISSINRDYYKKPIDFNAFKSSGNIEFTADVVIGLQYTFMETIGNIKENEIIEIYKEEKIKNPRDIQTVILKNRNGSIGKATNFQYEPQYNYFKEV